MIRVTRRPIRPNPLTPIPVAILRLESYFGVAFKDDPEKLIFRINKYGDEQSVRISFYSHEGIHHHTYDDMEKASAPERAKRAATATFIVEIKKSLFQL